MNAFNQLGIRLRFGFKTQGGKPIRAALRAPRNSLWHKARGVTSNLGVRPESALDEHDHIDRNRVFTGQDRRVFPPRPDAPKFDIMDVFDYLIFAALGAVSLVLALGIYSLFRGGDFGRSWSNKLMRLRVLTQAVAVAVLVAAVWWRGRHG